MALLLVVSEVKDAVIMDNKVMRFERGPFGIFEKSLHTLVVMQVDYTCGALYNDSLVGQNFTVIVTVVDPDCLKYFFPIRVHIFLFGQEVVDWIFFQSLFFHADLDLSDLSMFWIVDEYWERWQLCGILMHSEREDTAVKT